MNKKRLSTVLLLLTILTVVGSAVAYLITDGLMGTFYALMGAVLVVNLLISLFLVRKNMK